MAKNTWADLDTTTANNQDVLGQSALGTADANQLDAVDRSTLALMARGYADWGGVVTVGGSANAITVTSASTYQALETGIILSFKAASANTTAATLNLDGLGAKAIRRKGDVALEAGDIAANGRYQVVYDAAYNSAAGAWVLTDPEVYKTLANKTITGLQLTSASTSYPVFGQCQLVYSTTTAVKLNPYNGNLVTFPSGEQAVIPSAGITSTITSTSTCYINGSVGAALSATTLYYAYLWNQGSVGTPNWVIDWSTTSHATDTTSGIEIKSGDATRVLVGMIRTNAGPVVADTSASKLVASWFNRRPRQITNTFSTDRSTTSTSYTEINSEIRCTFVTWDAGVTLSYGGDAYSSSGTVAAFGGPSIDGATTAFPATRTSASTIGTSLAVSGTVSVTEGYHYATYMGATSSGTMNWDSGTQTGRLTGLLFI